MKATTRSDSSTFVLCVCVRFPLVSRITERVYGIRSNLYNTRSVTVVYWCHKPFRAVSNECLVEHESNAAPNGEGVTSIYNRIICFGERELCHLKDVFDRSPSAYSHVELWRISTPSFIIKKKKLSVQTLYRRNGTIIWFIVYCPTNGSLKQRLRRIFVVHWLYNDRRSERL